MVRIDYHLVFRSLLGANSECGDIGMIKVYDKQCFLALIDGLGHGEIANEAASIAYDYLEKNFGDHLVELMRELHEKLKGTRGIVAAFCHLNIETGDLRYVGIGNIRVKVQGTRNFSFVPRDGVVGYIIPTPSLHFHKLHLGDILLMYSDGIREHFNPLEHPGLFSGTAQRIAESLLEKFGKKNDDASCIALRYLI